MKRLGTATGRCCWWRRGLHSEAACGPGSRGIGLAWDLEGTSEVFGSHPSAVGAHFARSFGAPLIVVHKHKPWARWARQVRKGELREYSSQNGQRKYFGVSPCTLRLDVRAGKAFASCCGVNLAFAAFFFGGGVWVLSRGLSPDGSHAVKQRSFRARPRSEMSSKR